MSASNFAGRIERDARPARPSREGRAAWGGRRTILLVEDDADMRSLLATTLRGDGYRVVESDNGDDALDWLGPGVLDGEIERIPAAIVTDVRLPYFTGLEILAGVSCSRERIPVILITGFPDPDLYRLAFELGARSVLAKPFRLDDLRGALRCALHAPGRSQKP